MKCPVCQSGKLPDGTLSSPEHMKMVFEQTAQGVKVTGEPTTGSAGRLTDYTATVVFSRDGSDDGSVLDDGSEPKFPGLSTGQRLACQLADELQAAYDLTHMGGHFQVTKIDFRLGKDDPERLVADARNLYRVVTNHIEDGFTDAGLAGEVLEGVITLLSGERLIVCHEDALGTILHDLQSDGLLPESLAKNIDWC